MRFCFTSLLAVALSVAAASAQSLSDIPQCAQAVALRSITNTGCDATDFKCICNSQSWLSSLLPDLENRCSADDLKKTEDFAQKLCAAQSVTLRFSETASASATGTGAVHQATLTPTLTIATPTARPSSAATTVGFGGEKGGIGKLMLSTLGVAFGLIAWC